MKNIKFFIFKHKNLSLTNSFGEYKSYNYNGRLNKLCNYIDDKINGEFKEYYYNGCELSELSDNSKHKNLSSTDSFGQLGRICYYVNGKLNGEYKQYNYNRHLQLVCNYIDDKKNGKK
jgi:antitoxin component YwqK of YwqJK toxin-antitoxin module